MKSIEKLSFEEVNMICGVYNHYGCENCPLYTTRNGKCKNHTPIEQKYKDELINTIIPYHIQVGAYIHSRLKNNISDRKGDNILFDALEDFFGKKFINIWLSEKDDFYD